ncbi:hypothetical protein Tco_0444865 [Tanacetum coccineum]
MTIDPGILTRAVQDALQRWELNVFHMKAFRKKVRVDMMIRGRAYSDVLLNNLCEVFEGKNVQGRDKPIITTAGFIREYYIKRNVHVLKVTDKCLGPLTTTKSTIMAKLKQDASNSLFNGIEVISRPRKKRIRGAMEEPVVKNERLVRICKIVNVQMNDGDVSKQIEQMVRFIRQEADEKANEISVSAEELVFVFGGYG